MTILTVRKRETRSRHLYVVAIDRRDLYDSLRRRFANDPTVEVIFDRRKGERRTTHGEMPAERRRPERRQIDQAHLLNTLGVVLVSRDHCGEAAGARATRRPRRNAAGLA